MTSFRSSLKEVWDRLSWPDLASTAIAAVGLLTAIFGLGGGLFSFLKYLAVLAGAYLLFRLIGWWRNRLLWSLRNRLIVAYLFIAVVPILLIVTLVLLAGRILYSQLGAYILHEDIQNRVDMIADISEHIAIADGTLPRGVTQDESERILAAQSHAIHDRELLGLSISFADDTTLLRKITPSNKTSYAGLLQQGDSLSLTSLRAIPGSKGERIVMLRVPVTPDFLNTVAPDLGAIQLNLMERYTGGAPQAVIYPSGEEQYKVAKPIVARNRVLQDAMFWIDPAVSVVSSLDSVFVAHDGKVELHQPVLAVFNARPSRLNARIFTSLGELRDSYLVLLILVGIVFLLIEAAALATGIVLTRRITRAVADLYRGTQYVQAMDFSHRVQIEHRDQLGELAESFNQMTGSISTLIEEQNKRQRLENEISIAREVQNQLFPSTFSLQAALRSQMLSEGSERLNMAELVSRLNKHLVRNTGDDRFATFFIAIYDSATRTLRYTNAGHLPAFLICNGNSEQLDKGGMVLGVMEDYVYEEGSLEVRPDALLIGYSDGLIEPENVYGEEFGIRRLQEAAVRLQGAAPLMVAESLMAAAEEWAGTPEQADDMTVIVARLR
ncbi:MAG: hypothetical protein DMG53_00480 [Acidobacteria bacterium]|nr:MAG: hypothetical protein DMG53_00480 [Acidobacteriota bacterium]